MNVKLIFFLFTVVIFLFVGCNSSTSSNVDCNGITPTYNADIAPILTANCAADGCHGNFLTQAGINLTTFSGAKNGSANSKFLKAIKHQSGAESMPPSPATKLSDDNILLIECWIQNGKPE
ncbi:MAG: hypothetical protein WAT79_14530 [Saprospiraceae bacterium]